VNRADALKELELPESRWVDVDGPVHYREWPGTDDGPTFVCVHGLGGSLVNWALVAAGLGRRGRVLALDLPGFGLTAPEDRGTNVGAHWRLLGGFLRALGLPPAVLVGNSMGGMVSLIQAAHTPDSVDRLILVDAAFPRARSLRGQPAPRVAGAFTLYSSARLGEWFVRVRARRLGPEGLVREPLRVCSPDPASIDRRLVAALVELTRARQDLDYATTAFLDAARSIYRSQIRPGRYRNLVRAIRHPALVIHGAKDQLIPVAAAREAVADHPNWKLVVFPDLGHIPQMEAPDRWLAAVDAWLDDEAGRTVAS
jgi:pimeloyl-ACP methyl ester carboxylesterase